MHGEGRARDASRAHVVLERLGAAHCRAVLAAQDHALAEEVFGRVWTGTSLEAFLERASRWRPDGPIREFAAVRRIAVPGDPDPGRGEMHGGGEPAGTVVGGGGIHLLGAGLDRGQADLSYWVLAPYRRRGLGTVIARTLLDAARADPCVAEVVLRIAPANAASRAVGEALGAVRSGVSERHPVDATRSVERWVLPLD